MIIIKVKQKNFKKILKIALESLREGKVLIFPTDTVYGLICDAENKLAIRKIFKIKKRSFQKPISIFVKDLKMAKKFAKINKSQEKFLKKVWPGKAIVVLKANPSTRLRARSKFPKGIVCQWGKIGLRIPKYKLLNELLNKLNMPLAQTSANISGKPVPATVKKILKRFTLRQAQGKLLRRGSGQENEKQQPDMAIDAGKLYGKPSLVIDLTRSQPRILRK